MKEKTKKKGEITIPKINVGGLFSRFHMVIFTIVVGGGLAVAVYLFSNILTGSSTTDYTVEEQTVQFDEEVLRSVEGLRKLSDSPSRPDLPKGRIDPFPQ